MNPGLLPLRYCNYTEVKLVQGDHGVSTLPFHSSWILFYAFKCVNGRTTSCYWNETRL